MKKILFLHGFFASGSCVPATTLRDAFSGRAEVFTPDLPMHPYEALDFVRTMCRDVHPDILAGNSNGAFLAQIAAHELKIPALLGNPHFEMTKFLETRIGRHQYKSKRMDGITDFNIDEVLISEFASLQKHQFEDISSDFRDKVWGLFGDNDTLAHYESVFVQHYTRAFHFPGNHTPTSEEVVRWYVPLAERLLKECAKQ